MPCRLVIRVGASAHIAHSIVPSNGKLLHAAAVFDPLHRTWHQNRRPRLKAVQPHNNLEDLLSSACSVLLSRGLDIVGQVSHN